MIKLIKGILIMGLMVIFIEIGPNAAIGPVNSYGVNKDSMVIPIHMIDTNHAQFYNDFVKSD